MAVIWAILLVVVLVGAWLLTLMGMPGNWLMVAAVAAYAAWLPDESSLAIGWVTVGVVLLLALLGEAAEFLAGAAGAAKVGGSRRGVVLALVGSMAGGVLGLAVGAPIPVIGSLVAAVLLAALGAMVGAMLGESSQGRGLRLTWQIGKAAFRGRLWGTLLKSLTGLVMLVAVILAILF